MQQEEELDDGQTIEKYQGDLRKLLDEKKKAVDVSSSSNGGDRVTEQQGAGGMGLDLSENNGGKSHVDCPRSDAVKVQLTAGVTGVVDVPVAAARVDQELKVANPVGDRVSDGDPKGSDVRQTNEAANLQYRVDDSSIIGIERATTVKNHAAVAVFEKPVIPIAVGSELEPNIA